MKILLVTEGKVSDYLGSESEKLKGADAVIFNAEGIEEVVYDRELSGETDRLHEAAELSKRLNCLIIAGCDTDAYGVRRRSAVILDKGKIMGVSDMAHSMDESAYASGGGFRVFDTSVAKIGVLIREDLYFPESSRVLALCDADIIAVPFGEIKDHIPLLMARASSFANGVGVACSANGYCFVTDIRGETAFASGGNLCFYDFPLEKDFHLIRSRRRGCYKEFDASY